VSGDDAWSRVPTLRWYGWNAERVDAEGASLVVVPELGAKIVSITLEGDEADFLWRDETRP